MALHFADLGPLPFWNVHTRNFINLRTFICRVEIDPEDLWFWQLLSTASGRPNSEYMYAVQLAERFSGYYNEYWSVSWSTENWHLWFVVDIKRATAANFH